MRRLLLLWVLFFLICAGLGYPTMRYYDPRTRGERDSSILYHDLVIGDLSARTEALLQGERWMFEQRWLVPALARPIYHLSAGRTGSWNPVFFSLLVVNAALTATAALGLVIVGRRVATPLAGVMAALLLFVNFATPTYYVAALVDSIVLAGMVTLGALLLKGHWLLLPPLAAVTVAGKETFLVLGIAFATGWLLADWRQAQRLKAIVGVAAAGAAGLLSLTLMGVTRGERATWILDVAPQRLDDGVFAPGLLVLLSDHSIWYIFGWLVPLAWPSLSRLPRPWVIGSLCAVLSALMLGALSGEESVSRSLMNAAGPLLLLAAAKTLVRYFPAQLAPSSDASAVRGHA